jgi:hypothetical protein
MIHETKRSLPIQRSTNPSTTEITESRARPTVYAAFLPLDQSVSFEKVHGLSCCASPEEGHGKGIVSKGLLSVRISVQSGEVSCATPGPKKIQGKTHA